MKIQKVIYRLIFDKDGLPNIFATFTVIALYFLSVWFTLDYLFVVRKIFVVNSIPAIILAIIILLAIISVYMIIFIAVFSVLFSILYLILDTEEVRE